ncbi:acyl-CoA dehydrogenase [Croceicoccus estronivorus]|uniref:acyl-CoA dehydrogenase family protein n=1 Tax=Croceicoccus estronivorus TaxID=1172626 RepID=UPI0008306898|nr:acyl-CoA dehydrogenase family protein [Croceicoccus estronivorus]OCC25619.1 acyl-CoA dehydrogenase [Croceicoccus estronivorus]
MNFAFSEEEMAFLKDFQQYLEQEKAGPDSSVIFAPWRETDSWLVDSPERRGFMKRLAQAGYIGMSWEKQYGGRERPGVYDYLLNEELSSQGAPIIGKGVGCIGKTIIAHGSDKLKQEFLPQILAADIEFALGYSEPGAGSDLASLRLRAERRGDEWVLNGQKMWTTSAHFADWYWVAARTDPEAPKHKGISVFLVPMDHPGLTIKEIKTMGDHRTNEVFFDEVNIGPDYLVGEENAGWRYVCEALDYERFALYTVGPLLLKFEALVELAKVARRDGRPLSDDPVVRDRIAEFACEVEMATMLQRRVIAKAIKGEVPTVEAAMYKYFSTGLGRRIANYAIDCLGPLGLLKSGAPGAPFGGRWEMSDRATVVDTIGGGSTEVQKNIVARRGLGLMVGA